MDREELKTAVLDNMKARRSTRSYTQDPVPKDVLDEIIEAGRYAPSGNNMQTTHFYVITSAEKRAGLRAAVTATLKAMTPQEGMHQTLLGLIKRAQEGEVDVTYGAPALIVTANKKGSVNACADCSCALQNMMLAAAALEIGNVWINQFFMLRDAPPIKDFFAGIGVPEDEELYGALSVGFTENLETIPRERTGNPVTYIE